MSAAKYRLRALGAIIVESAGDRLVGLSNQRKRLALLVLLAAAGRDGISRDKLLAYLSPESDTDRARNALSQLLFGLRRDLGAEAIAGNGELRLNDEVISSDLGSFGQAMADGRFEDAVADYRGPFLDGFYLKDSPEFERWCEAERVRLAGDHARALEELARAAAQRGDTAESVRWSKRSAEAQPLGARQALSYMRALVEHGEASAALQHGAVFTALIRGELGTEPALEVVEFLQRLRAGHGARTPRPRSDTVEPIAAPATTMTESPSAVDRVKPEIAHVLEASGRPGRWRRAPSLIALATGAMLTAVVVAFTRREHYEPNTVVVIPFQNETNDTTMTSVGSMAADWITDGLARTQLADVVDFRTAALSARDTTPARMARGAPAIARELGAETVIHGIIYRKGDSLRVQTQLLRSRDGKIILQLEPVSAPVAEPARLLDPLRQRVMGAFATLTDARFERWAMSVSAPPTYEAYVAYAEALDLIARGAAPLAYERLLRSVTLDTGFVRAKVELLNIAELQPGAESFADSVERAALSARDRLTPFDQASLDRVVAYRAGDWPAVLKASRRLVDIAPRTQGAQLARAHAAIANNHFDEALGALHAIDLSRGWMKDLLFVAKWEMMAHHLSGDFEGALRELARARARFPSDYGICAGSAPQFAALGLVAQADSAALACMALPDAGSDTVSRLVAIGRELDAHGHTAAAQRTFERALAMRVARDPGARAGPGVPVIHWYLGNWAEANAGWRAAMDDTSQLWQRGPAAVAAARAGDTAFARATLRWIETVPALPGQDKLWRSRILLALGDREESVQLLRESIAGGVAPAFFLHAQWDLRTVAGLPWFKQLTMARR